MAHLLKRYGKYQFRVENASLSFSWFLLKAGFRLARLVRLAFSTRPIKIRVLSVENGIFMLQGDQLISFTVDKVKGM